MLTPLRSALSAWRPGARDGGGGPADPLFALLAAWPSLVGEAVARATRPVAIDGSTLVVLVATSAWNQQVSFLSGEILGAVRVVPGLAGMAKLRTRVGRLERKSPHLRARASATAAPPLPQAPAVPPAGSLDEALARLRTAAERVRDAKLQAGWKTCSGCGTAIPAGSRCGACAAAAFEQRARAAQRLMFDLPWLGFTRTAELVEGLTLEEYEAIRRELLARWWQVLTRVRAAKRSALGGRERLVASSYLLLQTGWEPDRMTPAIARNALGDDLFRLLYERETGDD